MTGLRVLVVEDSGTLRSLVRRMLLSGHHEVSEAADGPAGLRACRTQSPDVVLLDVEMPGMSGWEVLDELKADPAVADVPVVFLTGRIDTSDMVEGLRRGAHDYLCKPCKREELLARVHAAGRVKRLQDELRRRNHELDLVARTDALTGLRNRRHIEEHLSDVVSTARRQERPAAVLIVDVDHFKRVNDTHGHAAGDVVLFEVAGRLAASVRAGDVVGRWGGEEFLAVLPATDVAAGVEVAEGVRRAVASRPCALPDGGSLHVTVSIGCAAGSTDAADELLRRADAALYAAKADGRNRVALGSASPSPPLSRPDPASAPLPEPPLPPAPQPRHGAQPPPVAAVRGAP